MRYHISPKTRKVARCKAKSGSCPFEGQTEHFDTKEEAQEYANKKNQQDFSQTLYKSASKNTENNDNIALTVHPENINAHTEDISYGENLIFNAWIGDRRRELNRYLIDHDDAKVMETVKTFTEKDIQEAVKLKYIPANLDYNVEIVNDGGFGERVISIVGVDNDKTGFESKEFKTIPMNDGSYSIIPQTKKEILVTQERLENIVEKYNQKRHNLDGYHSSDFFVHSSIEGGRVPVEEDDNFNNGRETLSDFYQGKATEQELHSKLDNFYANKYENSMFEQLQVSNETLKSIHSSNSDKDFNKESAAIVSESLSDVEESLNLNYRTSVSVSMDYLKSDKPLNSEQMKFVDEKIVNAKNLIRGNKVR